MDPKNAEALNGLGVLSALRGQRDAAQYFTSALQTDPKYPAALLNSAVLAQQNPATRPAALQRYRDYLATHSSGSQAEPVKLLVLQLERELTPVTTPIRTNTPSAAPSAVKTNTPVIVIANTSPPLIVVKTNMPVTLVKTNPVAVLTNKPAVTPANVPVTIVAVTEPAPLKTATTEPLASGPKPTPTIVPQPASAIETTPATAVPEFKPAPAPAEKKRGFFSRLNPFGGKPKPAPTNGASRTIVLNPGAEPMAPEIAARAAGEKPAFPRYRYTSPAPPAVRDRATADRALQQALAAQRAGRTSEASAAFAAAVAADPGYFEAQYNAALLAFQSGETARALAGWETALALQPESVNTRYSFALTLKQAGYATDAAQELEKIIESKPDDARAHLALGNLYAQQLLEPAKARAHYKKFLELDPRNPQAAAVRFWLSANP